MSYWNYREEFQGRRRDSFVMRTAYGVRRKIFIIRNTPYAIRRTKHLLTASCIVLLFFCTSIDSFAYERDEKRAFEEIEALFLKEDFEVVKSKCDNFLRDYRTSRNRNRVRELRDLANQKLSGKEISYSDSETEKYSVRERSEAKPPLWGRTHNALQETYYIVQIGVFRDYKNVSKITRKLKKQGFETVVTKIKKNGNTFYKVRAGKFKNIENAEDLVRKLKRKGHTAEVINEG